MLYPTHYAPDELLLLDRLELDRLDEELDRLLELLLLNELDKLDDELDELDNELDELDDDELDDDELDDDELDDELLRIPISKYSFSVELYILRPFLNMPHLPIT
jgi:hypothetical protein